MSGNKCPAAHDMASAAAVSAKPTCPYKGTGAQGQQNSEDSGVDAGSAPDVEQKPLECPMGFGTGNTAKLDPLNCTLCRALYYDAAATACGHRFCRFCITPFNDCPICGADCQPLSDDADMQGTACRVYGLPVFDC